MAGRFTSDMLDLSRLSPPVAIKGIDYEKILDERLTRLVQLFEAAGIDFNVDGIEPDPGVMLQETDAYRELLEYAAINDAVRGVMLAFATGADLEHLGAPFGVIRLEGEKDERLRRRIGLAPDAYGTAGSEGGYIFWALSADVRVKDAVAIGTGTAGLRPGQVRVAISTDATDPADVLDIVTRKLFSRDIKPLTDMLTVTLAAPVRFVVKAVIEVPRGPDPNAVKAEALTRLDTYLAQREKIGAVVARSGLDGALHVGAANVVRLLSPAADVDPGVIGLAVCDGINVSIEVQGNS